ncbi:hypothetical protein GH714_037403 [Hevea brasiliensis]|uniref:Lipoyl-binding domain-containing protein n=1 Tax=Hevea brasiliensis TaxID=3981 RepID=A0A6A6L4J0_HEVBR|nr:hypothetical protein GH714_037403 [Hevea brasiliensis]
MAGMDREGDVARELSGGKLATKKRPGWRGVAHAYGGGLEARPRCVWAWGFFSIVTRGRSWCGKFYGPCLTVGRKLISSPVKQNVSLVSCLKAPEAAATASAAKSDGSLEKSSLRSATFPNGFEALVLEVCDETEIAELKLKVGDFEMHLRRNVGATKAPLSNISPTEPPPIPTKPMDSSKLAALEASGATGYVLVASPTVGSFRRNRTVKGKRQPPIFKEGDIIKEGQVIGYLDQFGTELPVKSDVAGEVLKLLFDDGGTDMLNFRINYSNDATLLKEGTIMEKVLYSHEPYVANAFGCCWLWRPSYCRLAIISWHQPVNFLSCLRIVELLMESSETNRGNPTTGISNEVPIPGRQSRAGSIDRNRADDLHIQPGSKDNPAKHEESIETCESVDRPGASKPPQAKSQRINTKWVFITKAGIIMGPSVLGMNKTYMEKIFPDKEMVVYNTMAKIGIGYFIFITAVKMDAARSLIATRTTRLISSLCFFMRIALTGIFASGVQQYTKGIVPGTGQPL